MSLTLQVRDNEDGTGASLTTAGASGVATVKVYRAAVGSGVVGAYTNIADGPSLGNLSGLVVDGLGYWSWYVTQSSNQSNVVYQPATVEGDSVWERCLRMVADRIASIGLKGLASNSVVALPPTGGVGDSPQTAGVVIGTVPKVNLFTKPFVAVYCTGTTPEKRDQCPINTDDLAYPVSVEYIGEDQEDDLERLRARGLMYYERIQRSLDNQAWDLRVPEVWNVECRPGCPIDERLLKSLKVRVGLVTAWCVARMWRGTTRPDEV